jgi:hypothetical protein
MEKLENILNKELKKSTFIKCFYKKLILKKLKVIR